MAIKPVSVTTVNGYIRRILSTDPILINVSVIGELSNLIKHGSGHWYFSLKDENSTIRCFLPRSRVEKLRFDLEEGMKITATGAVDVYEKNGNYFLNIRDIDIEGEGDLKKAFDLLVKKLSAEGLFDEERKKPVPEFPKRIGVVTSPTGAAVRDIITTIKRRNPLVDVLLYPCLVQGPDAADTVVEGIKTLNREFKNLDAIIVGRGGGSAEDLWTFNEESVARAIAASKVPVISAVGHEVDYVISDYVADVRAATPTAAAELAVPDIEYYKDIIRICSPDRMYANLVERLEDKKLHLDYLLNSCNLALDAVFAEAQHRLSLLKLDLEGYNPFSQLDKGYAVVKSSEGRWISGISAVKNGSKIKVLLKDGSLDCLVEGKEKNG